MVESSSTSLDPVLEPPVSTSEPAVLEALSNSVLISAAILSAVRDRGTSFFCSVSASGRISSVLVGVDTSSFDSFLVSETI